MSAAFQRSGNTFCFLGSLPLFIKPTVALSLCEQEDADCSLTLPFFSRPRELRPGLLRSVPRHQQWLCGGCHSSSVLRTHLIRVCILPLQTQVPSPRHRFTDAASLPTPWPCGPDGLSPLLSPAPGRDPRSSTTATPATRTATGRPPLRTPCTTRT